MATPEPGPTAESLPAEDASTEGDVGEMAADALFTKQVLATNVKQVHDVVAVSYTHLDVYKRQPLPYKPDNGQTDEAT